MVGVKVHIDTDSCVASATCTTIAPEVFAISDYGDHAVTLQTSVANPELVALIEEAEHSCPTAAIVLERPDGRV